MATKILKPGIENRYVTDTWEEMRRLLIERHGSADQLSLCIEIDLREELHEWLASHGFEEHGSVDERSYLLRAVEQRVEIYRAAEVTGEVMVDLDARPSDEWAKWYVTGEVGEPLFVCAQRWEE